MRVIRGLGTLLLLAAVGCATGAIGQSGRRYTDQMVVSAAVERALSSFETPEMLKGKKVAIELTTPGSSEEGYFRQALALKLIGDGVNVVGTAEEADYLFHIVARGLGLDTAERDLNLPIPFAGSAVPFFSESRQLGYVRFKGYVLDKERTKVLATTPTVEGHAHYTRTVLLGVGPIKRTDAFKEIGKEGSEVR